MGTITKRRKSYQAQISCYKNGKQNRITKTFPIKSDTKQWVRKMESFKDDNIKLYKWKMSFAEYYKDYIYNIKRHTVRDSTFQNYRQALKFIKIYAPNLEVRHLCYESVQNLIDRYSENRAKRTSKDFVDKIKPAITHASGTQLIATDFSYAFFHCNLMYFSFAKYM